ncbi:GW dipeptide domain-containing protein [Pediococcus argentinicus]|nr:GW dipeptide domain-containing protein [Pediococcus argentinicus]NKZ22751.1 N-acetylmuramoyl-L-alanine amidase [Pediococcus argentinicus]
MNMFFRKNYLMIPVLIILGCLAIFNNTDKVHAQSVNSYIYNNNLKHASITNAQWAGFPHPDYEHGYGKPEGVVVHETGNPNSSIFGEISFMKGNYDLAFVHSFVDADRIINIANTNYGSWGAGYPANAKFVQFEQVEMHSAYSFASEVNNSAYYTAYLLHQYKLPCTFANANNGWNGTVFSHYATTMKWHSTDHVDPVTYFDNAGRQFFGQSYTMSDFFQLVQKYYGQTNSNSNSSKVSYVDIDASARIIPTNNILYNHVPGSGYKVKQITTASKLSNKNVLIDAKANVSYGQPYYRIRYRGKVLGWLYAAAFKNVNDGLNYSSAKATAKIKSNASHQIFNHIAESRFKNKVVTSAKSLANKKVDITDKAQKNNEKTGYYKISSGGKSLGWLYQSDLLDVTDNIQYTDTHFTARIKQNVTNDFYNHVTKSAYIIVKNNSGKSFKGKNLVINCKAHVPV